MGLPGRDLVGCTSYCCASSASVFSPLIAASATLALKDGAWVRRVRLVMFAPDPRHPRRSQAEIPPIGLPEFGVLPQIAWIASESHRYLLGSTHLPILAGA